MVHRVRSQKIFLIFFHYRSHMVQMSKVVLEFRIFAQKCRRKVELAKSGLDGLLVESDYV